MKTLSAAVAAMLLLAAPVYAASPASGLWRTPAYNGEVQITDCGQALCGKIVTSDRLKLDPTLTDSKNKDPALRARLIKDLPMLEGFTGGPTVWKGGTVYNPDDGGTYKGSITLQDPDTLKLTGCIFVPLCKTQVWTRIK